MTALRSPAQLQVVRVSPQNELEPMYGRGMLEYHLLRRRRVPMAYIMPNSIWTVHVEDWRWTYTFSSKQFVSWLDPVNGMKGDGRWKIEKGRLIISWIGSKSWDDWDWPPNPKSQGGYCHMEGRTYDLWAESQRYYVQPGDVVEFEGRKYVIYPDEVRSIGAKGTVAWVCRNPGNFRDGDAYGAYPGKRFHTKSVGAFAIFPTEETGMQAILTWLRNHGPMTIADAFKLYAPPLDGNNDPVAYAKSVADAVGVTADTKIQSLNGDQLTKFALAIRRVEGWVEGDYFARDGSGLPVEVRMLMAPHLYPPTEEEIRNSSIGKPW